MEGSEDALFELMTQKKFSFVERALENGDGYINKIIDQAVNELEDNHRSNERLFETKKYCMLIFDMLQNRIISLGPKRRLTKETAKKLRYRKFLIPALLTKCDQTRFMGKRQMLAKLLSEKLIENGTDRNTLYCRIRNAGASLTFLRFHLQVDDNFFRKDGLFQCEALELAKEKFDIIYCLNRGFSWSELKSGFRGLKDDYSIFTEKNVNLNMLMIYKEKLFAMNFTVSDLKQSDLFNDKDLQEWYKKYLFEEQQNTTDSEEEHVINTSMFRLTGGSYNTEMTPNGTEETEIKTWMENASGTWRL